MFLPAQGTAWRKFSFYTMCKAEDEDKTFTHAAQVGKLKSQ